MVAWGELAPKGESRGDGDPDTRWGRQSSAAQIAADLWEAACADVAPSLAFVLDKVLSAKLKLKDHEVVGLLANAIVSSCSPEVYLRWSWWAR